MYQKGGVASSHKCERRVLHTSTSHLKVILKVIVKSTKHTNLGLQPIRPQTQSHPNIIVAMAENHKRDGVRNHSPTHESCQWCITDMARLPSWLGKTENGSGIKLRVRSQSHHKRSYIKRCISKSYHKVHRKGFISNSS